jgi:hypothetical protein
MAALFLVQFPVPPAFKIDAKYVSFHKILFYDELISIPGIQQLAHADPPRVSTSDYPKQ